MARGGGNKKIFQYCTDSSGEILYLQALQGHSGRSLIDPSHYRDNVLIPDDFFKYICHNGCAINLHSITNSALISGENLSKKQTVFFTSVDPMNKEHRYLEKIVLEAPRLARYMHTAWKKHQKHSVLGRH